MIAALDVHYEKNSARTACIIFERYESESPRREFVTTSNDVAEYESGAFYKRELPHLLQALRQVHEPIETVIVDGYVWLDEDGREGLGKYLYDRQQLASDDGLWPLGQKSAVVGVAKRAFRRSPHAQHVTRGTSLNPLFVTSVGVSVSDAAAGVKSMHGAQRLPTLLHRVDALCRGRLV